MMSAATSRAVSAINRIRAEEILREAAAQPPGCGCAWLAKVRELSEMCEAGAGRTHVAFLGTAILAKATAPHVDLAAVKPEHAKDPSRAWSARSLCHGTLVPLAAELGFSLGVTGREPLNNQPYFRMVRLGDGTPVSGASAAAFRFVVGLVDELQQAEVEHVHEALRAFISVRRDYVPRYPKLDIAAWIGVDALLSALRRLLDGGSQGGRIAQAITAGLMDACIGKDRVNCGRVNDPSRHYPGDVCIQEADGTKFWIHAIEVRDKPLSMADALLFARTCCSKGVYDASIVVFSGGRQAHTGLVERRPHGDGTSRLTVFHDWEEFARQALFWADPPGGAPARAAAAVHSRLVELEVSAAAVALWVGLVNHAEDQEEMPEEGNEDEAR